MASSLFSKKKSSAAEIRAAGSPPSSTRKRGATLSTSKLLRTLSTPSLFGSSESTEEAEPEKFAKKSLSLRTLKLLADHQAWAVDIEKKIKELKEVMDSTMGVLETLGETEEDSSQATDAGWTKQAVFEMQSVQRSVLASLNQEITGIRQLNGRIVTFTTKCKQGLSPVAPITKKRGSRMRSMTTSPGGLPKPNFDEITMDSASQSRGLPRPPSAPSGGGLPKMSELGRTYSGEYASSSAEPTLSRAKTLPSSAIAGGMKLPPPLPIVSEVAPKRYQALWDYIGGKRRNDLKFKKGDILCQCERNGEWVYGYIETSITSKGWFPANYCKPL